MSPAWRIAVAAGVVAAAVVLFLVLRPGDEEEESAPPTTTAPTTTAPSTTTVSTTVTTSPTTTTPPVVTVRILTVSVPASGPTEIVRWRVREDARVRIVVTLGTADEVHLHGYDLEAATGPGQPPARLDFRATTPGRFELELHSTGDQIAELRVDP